MRLKQANTVPLFFLSAVCQAPNISSYLCQSWTRHILKKWLSLPLLSVDFNPHEHRWCLLLPLSFCASLSSCSVSRSLCVCVPFIFGAQWGNATAKKPLKDIFIISSGMKNGRIQRMLMWNFSTQNISEEPKIALECSLSFFFPHFFCFKHKNGCFFVSASMLWNVSIQLHLFEQVLECYSLVKVVNLVLFFCWNK